MTTTDPGVYVQVTADTSTPAPAAIVERMPARAAVVIACGSSVRVARYDGSPARSFSNGEDSLSNTAVASRSALATAIGTELGVGWDWV